jgi:hypothetical protein
MWLFEKLMVRNAETKNRMSMNVAQVLNHVAIIRCRGFDTKTARNDDDFDASIAILPP